jgi:hypothetical protein
LHLHQPAETEQCARRVHGRPTRQSSVQGLRRGRLQDREMCKACAWNDYKTEKCARLAHGTPTRQSNVQGLHHANARNRAVCKACTWIVPVIRGQSETTLLNPPKVFHTLRCLFPKRKGRRAKTTPFDSTHQWISKSDPPLQKNTLPLWQGGRSPPHVPQVKCQPGRGIGSLFP